MQAKGGREETRITCLLLLNVNSIDVTRNDQISDRETVAVQSIELFSSSFKILRLNDCVNVSILGLSEPILRKYTGNSQN